MVHPRRSHLSSLPWSVAVLMACARSEGPDPAPAAVVEQPGEPAAIATPLRLPPAMREREWISIERTGCYGACPQFTLTATSAGGVEWIGRKDVRHLGPAYRVVDAAAVAQLYAGFAGLDWLDIPESRSAADDDCATDAPSTIVTIGRGSIGRTLYDYHGCQGEARTRMRALAKRLVDLLAAPEWVEAVDDPGADPRADAGCRSAAFRPLFTERASEPRASLSDAALSAMSLALHQGDEPSEARLLGVDDGHADFGARLEALRISLQRRIYPFGTLEARVVTAAPLGPGPGEIRVLVTPAGCAVDDGALVEAR